MALVTFNEIEGRAVDRYSRSLVTKSAGSILQEATSDKAFSYEFDVFLSHSYSDAKINMNRLLGLKALLEDFNLSVYVDWIIDANLDRETVSTDTAETLRIRMDHSKCLLFATSETSQMSKWMPWELGYMDAKKDKVAILPLVENAGRLTYKGQEYLGLYPYVDKAKANGTESVFLWVCNGEDSYVRLDLWLKGEKPRRH